MVQPTLLSMHNLFLLEHNRIAKGIQNELKGRLEPYMSPLEIDEILFQVSESLPPQNSSKGVFKTFIFGHLIARKIGHIVTSHLLICCNVNNAKTDSSYLSFVVYKSYVPVKRGKTRANNKNGKLWNKEIVVIVFCPWHVQDIYCTYVEVKSVLFWD